MDYGLLGVNVDRLGVSYEPHRHAFTKADWKAVLDFADWQLRGMPVNRQFDQLRPQAVP